MTKDHKGFLNIKRQETYYRPVCERVKDFKEVFKLRSDNQTELQATRCMDCGTPFCHWGCPVGNLIPEWNECLANQQWEKAFKLLNATNNLPEITGRVCPAPCEYSCVLGVNDDPVTIRENELNIIEHAFKHGLVTPKPPHIRTNKKVAVVGSGPAGLACAAQLNQAGHTVTVFEKDKNFGGILRYGIPDFKLEKHIIDRRLFILKREGIDFVTNTYVGRNYPSKKLLDRFDAVCLTGGSRVPRNLAIDGRYLQGIHFAMDYLTQSNLRLDGVSFPEEEIIDAKGKSVVIIGGGDTGADCMGTAHRQGAHCVVQIEIMPKPENCRTEAYPWPYYPLILKQSTSHEEGGERHWSMLTKKFVGDDEGRVTKLSCVRVEFNSDNKDACPRMVEIPGSEFEIDADLVILAIGFAHPEHPGIVKDLSLNLDKRGNVATDEKYMTSCKKVFCAGDMHRGQSLIVWAISEGRKAAHYIDEYLMGKSSLPMM